MPDHNSAIVVALIGGVGAGKTTCANYLAEKNVAVIELDEINAQLLADPEYQSIIIQEFGPSVAGVAGQLDKSKLANLVFSDPEQRIRLEKIAHPQIEAYVREKINVYRKEHPAYILVVIPLLPKNKRPYQSDWMICLDAPLVDRKTRILKRPNMTTQRVEDILDAQYEAPEYRDFADEVIENDGDLEKFQQQLDELHERLRQKSIHIITN